MNEDPRYLRAAIRHRVIPAIQRETGREVSATFARTAAVLREDRDELIGRVVELWPTIVETDGTDVRLRAAELAALPRSLASRLVRLALWNMVAVDEPVAPWTRETVAAVLDLAAGRPGRRRDLPGGRAARRDRVYVHVASPYRPGDARLMGEQP